MTISAVKAQDLIVLKNAEEIQAKVTTIAPESISYLRWNNLEGPTYTILKSDILYIKYRNGEKEVMKVGETRGNNSTNNPVNEFRKAKFQGYANVGADFSANVGGPSLDFSLGIRSSKYFYMGAGFGWHNLIVGDFWSPYLTFTSDIKAYIPINKEVLGRLDLSFGGCVFPNDYGVCGFFMNVGAGIEWRRYSFGIGYQMPVTENFPISLGYVKIGYRFGR